METNQTAQTHSTQHFDSTPQSPLLVIDRDFNVPVKKLFDAFTNVEKLKAWFWPNGLYSDHIEMDFREGGKYFINMKGMEDHGGGMIGQFEEIIPNKRIVLTSQLADKNGNPISAKDINMPGEWPEIIYITYEFSPITESKSHFKLSQQGIPNEAQRDCYRGWGESFDKLERYLSGGM